MSESLDLQAITAQCEDETTAEGLRLESTVAELSLHDFHVEMSRPGHVLSTAFHNPVLPGAILVENDQFRGMISRRRFTETMNQPFAKELYSNRPLWGLVNYLEKDSQFSLNDVLICPSDMPIVKAATQSLQRSPELLSEPLVVSLDDGSYRLLDVHKLLVAHAQIHELATRMLKHQLEVRNYAMLLEHKNAELERIDQLKDAFLANTSHELRTPLNGIIGIAESMLEGATGELSQLQRQNLMMIAQSGHRLTNLVNDILDFSKLKHKNLDLQLAPVPVQDIAQTVLTLSKPLIGKKALQLINHVPDDFQPADADENRVQQIMLNLVGNAIKFTESGAVEVSATLEGDWIKVNVKDSGIGIPEDKLESIFESFEQGDGSTARKYGGTGLGLAITRQLVELHGGQISVHSSLGNGSTFTFTLPTSKTRITQLARHQTARISQRVETDEEAVAAQIDKDTATEDTTIIAPSASRTGPLILIVDDEPVNHQVLVNHLSVHNYRLMQAYDGPEALAIIYDEGIIPELILLDVMMPNMSGYEVTHKLREKWPANELPILLLTAKNQVHDLVEGLEAGANDYLTKPVSKDELLARMKTHISLKNLTAENARLSAELDITRRLQKMLLPKDHELQRVADLDIAGYMEPADEVGGDYYDVLQYNGEVACGIGDVTGHGLESGVLMLMVQTAVRTLLAVHETDPVKFFTVLNRTIYDNIQRMDADKNLTLAVVNYQNGELRVSGQHEEMIVVRANGEVELIDTLDLGFPIGLEEDIAAFVGQKRVKLNPGDVVALYTDGITEAENMHNQQYGLEKLCEVVKNNGQQAASVIRQAVIDDVRSHIGEQKVYDDITLLVLKHKELIDRRVMH